MVRGVHRFVRNPCGDVFDLRSLGMATFSDTLADAVARLQAVPRDPALLSPLPEPELHALVELLGEARRAFDAVAAFVTGEVTRRSAPELGVHGFAANAGF